MRGAGARGVGRTCWISELVWPQATLDRVARPARVKAQDADPLAEPTLAAEAADVPGRSRSVSLPPRRALRQAETRVLPTAADGAPNPQSLGSPHSPADLSSSLPGSSFNQGGWVRRFADRPGSFELVRLVTADRRHGHASPVPVPLLPLAAPAQSGPGDGV